MTVNLFAGGLVFRGGEGQVGFFIEPGGIEGWDGGVGASLDTADRPSGGSYDTAPKLADRLVTVRGRCHAESPRDLFEMGDRMAAIGSDGLRFRLTVEQYGRNLWAWARRAPTTPKFYAEPAFNRADYQTSFWLPNPRRFGETRQSPPTASLQSRSFENRGTFPASPRFFVEGPQPTGYRIWGEGNADPFEVTTPLAAGVTDVVDFTTGTVVRGGTLLVGGVAAPRVWTVGAASSRRWEAALSGAGTIAGEITDTYV